MADSSKPLLTEAQELIDGDRQAQHGDPFTCHQRIATLWSTILGIKIIPIQVVQCMAALKLARSINDPTARDNWLDLAGYAGLSEKILKRDPQ